MKMKVQDVEHNSCLVLQTPSKYSHRCCSSRWLCWVFLWYLLACLCLDAYCSKDVLNEHLINILTIETHLWTCWDIGRPGN